VSGSARRVLVVEDDPMSRELLADILSASGWSVTPVESGEEALVAAASQELDLVLLDIGLPGIDGFETVRRLRSLPATRRVPIVAVTALAMTGDAERALAEGFDAYLTKPLDTRGLVRAVEAIVSRRG
jgi:CheY-like chemotaxis protein